MIEPESQRIVDATGKELDFIMEGQTAFLEFDLKNKGTAPAFGINSELLCEGMVIENVPSRVTVLDVSTSKALRWEVTGETLDWWEQSRDAE